MIGVGLAADATRVIESYAPRDVEQQHLRFRYLRFLAEHPDSMSRECRAGHLTASTLVIDPRNFHVLLTLHRKSGRWLQFGGHCESGDLTLAAAAEREAREESGLDDLELLPDPLELDEHFLGPDFACAPTHLDVRYVARASSSTAPIVSPESLDVRWLPSGAPEIADASLRRLIAGAIARLAHCEP